MDEKIEIMNLLQNKQLLEHELQSLAYGSVEIRENDSNRYLYVHYREDGVVLTKYVGEYSDDLYNLILNNNIKAKDLKKQIREINKKLKQLNYKDPSLCIYPFPQHLAHPSIPQSSIVHPKHAAQITVSSFSYSVPKMAFW